MNQATPLLEDDEPMAIVGYADALSVLPGQPLELKVSTIAADYRASVVRLIHGDTNPAGPGYKDEPVASLIEGTRPGRWQPYRHGSHVTVEDPSARLALGSFTLQCWILPTLPTAGPQGILTRWADGRGYALMLGADGHLELRVGEQLLRGEQPLTREWLFVAATFDAATGAATLTHSCVRPGTGAPAPAGIAATLSGSSTGGDARQIPFLIAALAGRDGEMAIATAPFNGKIDRPRVFPRPLSGAELAALAADADVERVGSPVTAAWDLGAPAVSDAIPNLAGGGLHGTVVNMPLRAATGHNWSGAETDPRLAPEQYAAIHFHEDDLDDAGWETDFVLDVPADLPSGIYAVHLETDGGEDYVPFFVRPPRGRRTADIAVLLPTLTYLAYGNEHVTWMSIGSPPPYEGIEDNLQAQDHHAVRHRLLSLYDSHSDGSGVAYSSRLRPIVNMRPKYSMALLRSPHLLNADLHLTDWLEHKGYAFDVITDEDLHHEGSALIDGYKTVLTGSHPEYWSGPMLDAIDHYRDNGGRLMYLGANGFYWVTPIDPNRPHLIEVRRGHVGTGTWRSAPGEEHNSCTGERGGVWRYRGRAPQVTAGIGYTATGYAPDMPPYRRTAASFDPRAAFLFEGVGDDEPIGIGGLVLDGAAGFEIDRADAALGTPAHALVVATASGYSDHYQGLSEEVMVSDSQQGGTVSPLVRADLVYYETPGGGAVFSVGAISWCGSLSWENYDSAVSRITENALRRFVGE